MSEPVYNQIIFTGPSQSVAALRKQIINHSKDYGGDFDFERIVPMPESIRKTEHLRNVRLGRAALTGIGLEEHLTWSQIQQEGISTAEQLKAYLENQLPSALDEARIAMAAEAETGFCHWSPWSEANWGAKYSYSYSEEGYNDGIWECSFITPWTPPVNLFKAIAQQYPDLSGRLLFNEDYCDYRYGYYCFRSGASVSGWITGQLLREFQEFPPKSAADASREMIAEFWNDVEEMLNDPNRQQQFEEANRDFEPCDCEECRNSDPYVDAYGRGGLENEEDNEVSFFTKHYEKLIGFTIERVIITEDCEYYGLGLVNKNKRVNVWIDCDPEGNGPGFLHIEQVRDKLHPTSNNR